MPQAIVPAFFGPGSLENGPPAVKIPIGAPVTSFQSVGREFCRAIDDMARVVEIPVAMEKTPLLCHALVQGRGRVGSENVKGRGFHSLLDGPFDGTLKDGFVIIVHAKNKAPIDHDPKIVETLDSSAIVSIQILILVLFLQIRRTERFK